MSALEVSVKVFRTDDSLVSRERKWPQFKSTTSFINKVHTNSPSLRNVCSTRGIKLQNVLLENNQLQGSNNSSASHIIDSNFADIIDFLLSLFLLLNWIENIVLCFPHKWFIKTSSAVLFGHVFIYFTAAVWITALR